MLIVGVIIKNLITLFGVILLFSCSDSPNGFACKEASSDVEIDQKPTIIERGTTRYPQEAQKAGVQGLVLIEFLIDCEGYPRELKVIKGHPMLNNAAMVSASEYRFTPAAQNGKKVSVKWQIPFRFSLRN